MLIMLIDIDYFIYKYILFSLDVVFRRHACFTATVRSGEQCSNQAHTEMHYGSAGWLLW